MTNKEKLEKCIAFIKRSAMLGEKFPEIGAMAGISFMAAELLINIGEKLPNES